MKTFLKEHFKQQYIRNILIIPCTLSATTFRVDKNCQGMRVTQRWDLSRKLCCKFQCLHLTFTIHWIALQVLDKREMFGDQTPSNIVWWPNMLMLKGVSKRLRAWTNEKCLATKHHQTLFGAQTYHRLDTLFGAVWSCLIEFNRVRWCLIKFEGHQTFRQKGKLFLLFSCLIGDVLYVWTAAYQASHVWCGHAYHACSAACINCLIHVWSNMF